MQKLKSKHSISKKSSGRPVGSGHGKRIPGTEVFVTGTARGDDPKLILHPEENTDFEEIAPIPNDNLSRHQYPPPKKNPKFRKIWGQFIDGIACRENFDVGHLNSLEILCDLFVEYEEVSTFIRKKGRSYQTIGRSGMIWKFYPEVGQLKAVQHQINVYMKQLGLVLKKDEFGSSDNDKGEWE